MTQHLRGGIGNADEPLIERPRRRIAPRSAPRVEPLVKPEIEEDTDLDLSGGELTLADTTLVETAQTEREVPASIQAIHDSFEVPGYTTQDEPAVEEAPQPTIGLTPGASNFISRAGAGTALVAILTVAVLGYWFGGLSTGIGLLLMLLLLAKGAIKAMQTVLLGGLHTAAKIRVWSLLLSAALVIGGLVACSGTVYFETATIVAIAGLLLLAVLGYARTAALQCLTVTTT